MENGKQINGNGRAADNNMQAVHGMHNTMLSERYERAHPYSKINIVDLIVKGSISVFIILMVLLCVVYAAKDKIAALAVSMIGDSMSGKSYSSPGSQTGDILENMFRSKKTDIADTPENRASGKSIDASELFPAEKPQGSSIGFVTMPEMDDDLPQEVNNNPSAAVAAQKPENYMSAINQMTEIMSSPVYQSYMKEISEAIKQDTGTDVSKNPMAVFGVLNKSPKAKAVAEKYRNNPEFMKIIAQFGGMFGAGKTSFGGNPSAGMPGGSFSGNRLPKSFSLQVSSGSSAGQSASGDDDSKYVHPAGNGILGASSQGSPAKVVSVPKSAFSTRGASAANSSAGMPFED